MFCVNNPFTYCIALLNSWTDPLRVHTFRVDLFDGGGSGAVGEGGLFVGVRADEGDGIFSLSRAHQRRSVINQRHPALLSVVNDLLTSKLLQITVAGEETAS